MTESVIFGLDAGNSEASATLVLDDKERVMSIPSEIGAGSLRELTRLRGGANLQLKLQTGVFAAASAENTVAMPSSSSPA
jgi:hypothetical protein